MSKTQKHCFVICPIGDDGSDIRKHSDDLLELAIEPALEPYGFTVVRADLISRPSTITNDIVSLVQESEICIVDLTGHNPNVFYECGRRHETGKPCIQLVRKGDDIPFDVAGIRTIIYDLSSPRGLRDTVVAIRDFVKSFEESGYATPTSAVSLTSIAQALERIERSLTRSQTLVSPKRVENQEEDTLWAMIRGPREAILNSIREGDFLSAERILLKTRDRMNKGQLYEVSSMLAISGSKVAFDLIFETYDDLLNHREDADAVKIAFGSMVQYCLGKDEERIGLDKLSDKIRKSLDYFAEDAEGRAFINFQISRLYVGLKDADSALLYVQRAADLSPSYAEHLAELRSLMQKGPT